MRMTITYCRGYIYRKNSLFPRTSGSRPFQYLDTLNYLWLRWWIQRFQETSKASHFSFIQVAFTHRNESILITIYSSNIQEVKTSTMDYRFASEVNITIYYPDCVVENPSKLGDGICNWKPYNTERCGWDGGDCLIENYPDCHVPNPSRLGNGICD